MKGKFTFESNNRAFFAKSEDEDSGEELMRFSVAGYTGGIMESGYGKVAIDLEGMSFRNEVTPMFQHHDSTRIVGHADTKEISDGGLMLSGVISGTGEAAKEVISTSKNGFPWQASVGVSILDYKALDEDDEMEVNGTKMSGPGVVLTKTELFETSFVPLGRDKNTSSTLFSEDFEMKLQPNKEQIMEEKETVEVVDETPQVEEEVTCSISEMKEAFPGNAVFALDCLERGLSILEAKAEFADKLLAERDELADELAELQAAMEEEQVDEGGIPVEYLEEPQEQFDADSDEAKVGKLVEDAKAEFGMNDSDALRHVLKNNPELADKLI